MKKTIKIIGYTFASLILVLIILVVSVSFSQKKIVDIALQKISKSIAVPIEISDLSFTLIKRFPYATFELSGVKLGSKEDPNFVSQNNTDEHILNIERVFILVKTIPLIKGEFEIIKLEIDEAAINYKIDSVGSSNIDFLWNANTNTSIQTDTISSVIPALSLIKAKLTNTSIHYQNDSAQISADMFIPTLEIAGKMVAEKYTGTVEGDLILTKCSFCATSLNRLEEATFDYKLEYNEDTLQIKSFSGTAEDAYFGITGKAAYTDNLFADLVFEAKELDLGKLQKYVPEDLMNEFGIQRVEGEMQFSGTIKGNVSDSIMPSVDVAVILTNGSAKIKDYPEIKRLSFNGKINNGSKQNNKTTSAIFKSFYAKTDSSSVDMSFSVSNLDKPNYSLKSTLNINVEEFKEFIPDSLIQNISGLIKAEISTKGQVPDSINDNFINLVARNSSAKVDLSNFNIQRDSFIVNDFSGSIIYNPGNLKVSNLNVLVPSYHINLTNTSMYAEFKGELTEPQKLGVFIKAFHVESPQGKVWGSAKIESLQYLDFNINASANLNLAELKPFLPDTLLNDISGNLKTEISTYGRLHLDSIADQINDIVFKQSNFTFDAEDISITMSDTLQKLTNFNGKVKMFNDTISISKTNGIAAGIDFKIDSTIIRNAYKAVLENQQNTVYVQGNLEFGAIDYSVLTSFLPVDSLENNTLNNTNSSNKIESENSIQNFLYEFKGKIAAKSFEYEKIRFDNISCKFKVTDSLYIVDQLKLDAYEGSANTSLKLVKKANGKQIANVKTEIDKMNISTLLYAFDNFEQDSLISYENISGLFSAILNGRFILDADTIVTIDTRVLGDLTLEKGRLVNYQPAMDVASFTRLKELDNIELKTLTSKIFLFKNQLYVPVTDVVSSSMDFSTFGMQSLGEDYEYHLRMHLGEVLKGKSKKLIEEQNKSGDSIDKEDIDRNAIKIIYAYIDGKQKTGFDNKKAQKAMARKIEVQQKMLDLIFHPKLVSFETGVK